MAIPRKTRSGVEIRVAVLDAHQAGGRFYRAHIGAPGFYQEAGMGGGFLSREQPPVTPHGIGVLAETLLDMVLSVFHGGFLKSRGKAGKPARRARSGGRNRPERMKLPSSEAEWFLKPLQIKYWRLPDGSILVPGDLDISQRGLAALPDLSQVIVGGNFDCSGNSLTSLRGAPQTVYGNFVCYNNQLVSLEGAPESIGGYFSCACNRLASLAFAPANFKQLFSDFGPFSAEEGIPESLLAPGADGTRRA